MAKPTGPRGPEQAESVCPRCGVPPGLVAAEMAGVVVKPLAPHRDDRGWLAEVLRCDDPEYTSFGQVYVSWSRPLVVRAWHFHRRRTDYIACIQGQALLALCDLRLPPEARRIAVVPIGEEEPVLVRVPPLVAHGVAVLADGPAVLVEIASEPHQPSNPDRGLVQVPQDVPKQLEEVRVEYPGHRGRGLHWL